MSASKVAIVVDSTADFAVEDAAALDIDVVPLFVNFGDESFRDVVDLSRDEFYHRLEMGLVLPTTSQPTSAMFENVFRPHAQAGREIVVLCISAALSGTINAAKAAAEQFPSTTIRLVDSWTVSGGLQLLARYAREQASAGMDAQAVADACEEARQRDHLYTSFPDLSHAVRTGRVSKTQAMLGNLMKIVPILSLAEGGKVTEAGRVRTFARAQDALIDATLKDVAGSDDARIAVCHSRNRELAEDVRARLVTKLQIPAAWIAVFPTGPVIATHAGLGALGIFNLVP